MKKLLYIIPVLGLLFGMAFVSAAPVEKTDGFVCPVIGTSAVMHSPNGAPLGGGYYTILGPNVSVPVIATNGNGLGVPGGPHASPGDTNYTAVWAYQ